MTQHTQEPWRRRGELSAVIEDRDGRTIGSTVMIGDASRIVACVNLCAGLEPNEIQRALSALAQMRGAGMSDTDIDGGNCLITRLED